jgi:hypothetical protein
MTREKGSPLVVRLDSEEKLATAVGERCDFSELPGNLLLWPHEDGDISHWMT